MSISQIPFVSEMKERTFRNSVILGLIMLLGSLIINYFAGTYATINVTNRVGDLIIDNIGPYNVDMIFEDGSLLLWFFMAAFFLIRPKYIPAYAKSVTLFLLIRSFFIILTHLAPPHEIVPVTGFLFSKFTFGGDLFFSGHTGLPFLLALIFWDDKRMRYLFITLSVLFGTVALVGHKHYSIDVFAAFFITYSIYKMSRYFFPADFKLIDGPEKPYAESGS